jgi:GTP cyclohydrolase I
VEDKKTPGGIELVEAGFRLVLEGIGADLDNEHFKDTPRRAAKAFFNELCAGMTQPEPKITTFPATGPSQLILLRDIPVKSFCAHHLLPFVGKAAVAYIPGKKQVLGLSKLSRIVDWRARRPQVQEDLTNEVADYLYDLIKGDSSDGGRPRGGVGVLVRASHFCMCVRGVNHTGDMVTSSLRGVFHDPEVRAEFMSLAKEMDR